MKLSRTRFEDLPKEKQQLVREIMERESPQKRVDDIVERTKIEMEICQKESR